MTSTTPCRGWVLYKWCLKAAVSLYGCVCDKLYEEPSASVFSTARFFPPFFIFIFPSFQNMPSILSGGPQRAIRAGWTEQNGTKLTELCGFFGVPRPLFPIIGLQVSGPLCTICLFACSATFQNAPHPQPLPMSDERKPCLARKASPRFRSF